LSKSLYRSCLCLLPRPHLPCFIISVFKLRSVLSPFQSECSTDVDLLLRMSISRKIFLSKRLSNSCLRLLLHSHPPLSFLQCVTKVGSHSIQKPVPHRGRSLVSYFRFPNNPLPQFHPVAAYAFFFILIFLLSLRLSLTTVWCIPDSKATSLHRSM
jgi:hypothetical protein